MGLEFRLTTNNIRKLLFINVLLNLFWTLVLVNKEQKFVASLLLVACSVTVIIAKIYMKAEGMYYQRLNFAIHNVSAGRYRR